MLAIEVALAGEVPVPTMIFDEVDAGIGGGVAVEVGRRLAALSKAHPGNRRDSPASSGGFRRSTFGRRESSSVPLGENQHRVGRG